MEVWNVRLEATSGNHFRSADGARRTVRWTDESGLNRSETAGELRTEGGRFAQLARDRVGM